jgi:Putative Actinobacterial Holin-X, holin superfamily III
LNIFPEILAQLATLLLFLERMGSVRRLPVSARPHHEEVHDAGDESVVTRLAHLLRLELELGLADVRHTLRGLVIALAIAVPAAIALIASLVVLIAALLSPLFNAPWQPLLIAGAGVALLSLAALGWSAWRLRHLSWPTETLKSFEETWRWLVLQLRSRLTLRAPAA